MILLDEPYASEPLLDWMERSQHPVLANPFTQSLANARPLNLVDAHEAARRIEHGERVYTNSENALEWIVANTENEQLNGGIRLFKDKAAMREKLAPLTPEVFFRRCPRTRLADLDPDELPMPIVLKPQAGFCSMGVHVVRNADEWRRALDAIERAADSWRAMYPESVIDADDYLLESYVTGTEYALDAYFDENGAAHVLNVLRHDFASDADTSDRLYVTSAAIVRDMRPRFTGWLSDVNNLVGVRNFPVHVEVREEGGRVVPIEFNPLRFAGLGGTDVAWHGFGYRTYEAFLEKKVPDFDACFAGREDKTYSMSLLNPPADATGEEAFDYEGFAARFSRVLCLQRFDVNRVGSFGFLFLETDADTSDELAFLLESDLREFLT